MVVVKELLLLLLERMRKGEDEEVRGEAVIVIIVARGDWFINQRGGRRGGCNLHTRKQARGSGVWRERGTETGAL